MSYLREQDDLRDHSHDDGIAHKEHELTLSTAAIFGIFFGQVVLCAIFFGFGYSLGGHHSGNNLPSEGSSSSSNPNFGAFKPAAGQPAPVRSTASSAPANPASSSASSGDNADLSTPAEAKPTAEGKPAPVPIVRLAPPPAETTRPAAAPAAVPPSGYLVQVAAISITHPEDATMLQNALRAKGYAVSAKSGPDNFIHLLLGPFPERSGAEAMRQRLLTDGYTAYIK